MTQADFWFDPICPWTWITSRWLVEAAAVRDLQIRWHPMSLAILNAGNEIPPEYQRLHEVSTGFLRVIVATDKEHGQPGVEAFYDALGEQLFVQGNDDYDAVLTEALVAAGLPAELAAAAGDAAHDADLKASHDAGMALVGMDVGSPVISVPGPTGAPIAFFGPVISPAPKGEDAGRLWDGVITVAGIPGFYELKRTRDSDPDFS